MGKTSSDYISIQQLLSTKPSYGKENMLENPWETLIIPLSVVYGVAVGGNTKLS